MQGFIETAFGLKPLNLTNIQNVTYYTNTDIPYLTGMDPSGNLRGVKVSTGSLVIEYIGNATGYRNSGGNLIVGLDHYADPHYPVDRFWAWVSDVSSGSVTKTFNQYLNNRPAYGISTFAVTDFAPIQAYAIKLSDTQTIEDACDLVFKVEPIGGQSAESAPNYVTLVTDGQTSFPEIGTRVFLSSTQGYSPNNFDNAPAEHFPGEMPPSHFDEEINEKNVNPSSSMATSPLVADGRYAWLDGTPENVVDQFPPNGGQPQIVTNAQTGMVYEVVIKSGRVHEVVICPADFDAFNAAKDIPGKMYSRVYFDAEIEDYTPTPDPNPFIYGDTQSANCPCWVFSEPQINKAVGLDTPALLGVEGGDVVCVKGKYGGLGLQTEPNPWYDVTLGFTGIPPAQLLTQYVEEGPGEPIEVVTLVCPTTGGGVSVEEAEHGMEEMG